MLLFYYIYLLDFAKTLTFSTFYRTKRTKNSLIISRLDLTRSLRMGLFADYICVDPIIVLTVSFNTVCNFLRVRRFYLSPGFHHSIHHL